MEAQEPKTRVRINYSISAKGLLQPDITSEAEDSDTALANLQKAKDGLDAFIARNGYKTSEVS
jgi:hypothetical protein